MEHPLVAGLWQHPALIYAVQIAALEPGAGVALVKVAPQAGVFIAQGEDGLGDLAVIRVEALFNDLPGVHLEVTVRIFSHFSFTP